MFSIVDNVNSALFRKFQTHNFLKSEKKKKRLSGEHHLRTQLNWRKIWNVHDVSTSHGDFGNLPWSKTKPQPAALGYVYFVCVNFFFVVVVVCLLTLSYIGSFERGTLKFLICLSFSLHWHLKNEFFSPICNIYSQEINFSLYNNILIIIIISLSTIFIANCNIIQDFSGSFNMQIDFTFLRMHK
jgi:hypothetical protein